ncbi:uncharacterized protein [Bemisia tabaci]|uniref:uncharacterized protein n=1 Tax=Bemisia tabaci TaxID=7038 RepID=UPI003B2855F1
MRTSLAGIWPEGVVFAAVIFASTAANCPSFREFFSKCKKDSPSFDGCLVNQLNRVKHCYSHGDTSLGIPSFDPIRYGDAIGEPVTTTMRYGNLFDCKLILPNLTEWAWSNSTYTKVKTDFKRKMVQIYQTVPLKHVKSDVIGSGEILGVPFFHRKGEAVLDMIGVKQKFTIQMQPNGQLKVNLAILSFNDMALASRGLLHDEFVEKVINNLMRRFWRLGYPFFQGFAYEISDKAKTMLFNQLFKQIDWESLFGQSFPGAPSHIRR